MSVSRRKLIPALGLLGSVLSAIAVALTGDFVTAAGIVTAALSSSEVVSR